MMHRVSTKKGPGDCFESALKGVLNGSVKLDNGKTIELDGHARLVHGVVWNPKDELWMAHGWIESSQHSCINTATGYVQHLNRRLYYSVGRVKATIRYTRQEALAQARVAMHYGPWNITEPTTR